MWLRFGIAALAALPSSAYGQDAEDQRRLKNVAESAKLVLNELPACEGVAQDSERASTFGTVGEVFLYVATHYGYTPSKESHVLYYVKWALEAFKKSSDCDPSYANHDVSRKALWLIAWHVRWLNENRVPEEMAKVHMEALEQARKQVVVPKAPECPSCPKEKPPAPVPAPAPTPAKETGYYPRFGGRYSLGVEVGMFVPTTLKFNGVQPERRSSAAIGLTAGWRIPKKLHVFEVGGRWTKTFGKALPYIDYPVGLVSTLGGFVRYGVAPLEGKVSIHLGFQAGVALLPDKSGVSHIAPGLRLCVLEEVMCLSTRLVFSPAGEEQVVGVLPQLGVDFLRIVDYVLKRKL